jgi:Chalcone isomerase-like
MRKAIGALAVAGALLAAVPSFAVEATPTAKPAEIANVIKADAPYGAGKMRVLLMTAYDASLWTDAAKWSMQVPFALNVTYHFACTSGDIADRLLDEISHVNPNIASATLAHYRSMFAGLFPDAKSGDKMTALYTPDGTIRFYNDGQQTGQVHDASFAQAFFGVWLSPATSEPGLRQNLLHTDT